MSYMYILNVLKEHITPAVLLISKKGYCQQQHGEKANYTKKLLPVEFFTSSTNCYH
jgi:hypothetical protein